MLSSVLLPFGTASTSTSRSRRNAAPASASVVRSPGRPPPTVMHPRRDALLEQRPCVLQPGLEDRARPAVELRRAEHDDDVAAGAVVLARDPPHARPPCRRRPAGRRAPRGRSGGGRGAGRAPLRFSSTSGRRGVSRACGVGPGATVLTGGVGRRRARRRAAAAPHPWRRRRPWRRQAPSSVGVRRRPARGRRRTDCRRRRPVRAGAGSTRRCTALPAPSVLSSTDRPSAAYASPSPCSVGGSGVTVGSPSKAAATSSPGIVHS